jgi:hypothetical protein
MLKSAEGNKIWESETSYLSYNNLLLPIFLHNKSTLYIKQPMETIKQLKYIFQSKDFYKDRPFLKTSEDRVKGEVSISIMDWFGGDRNLSCRV